MNFQDWDTVVLRKKISNIQNKKSQETVLVNRNTLTPKQKDVEVGSDLTYMDKNLSNKVLNIRIQMKLDRTQFANLVGLHLKDIKELEESKMLLKTAKVKILKIEKKLKTKIL